MGDVRAWRRSCRGLPACSLLCAQEELADEQLLVELGFDSNHTKSGAVGRWKEGLGLWLGDAHAQRPRVH